MKVEVKGRRVCLARRVFLTGKVAVQSAVVWTPRSFTFSAAEGHVPSIVRTVLGVLVPRCEGSHLSPFITR